MAAPESETLAQVKYYLSQAQRSIDSLRTFKQLDQALKSQIHGTSQRSIEHKIMGSISKVGSTHSRLSGSLQETMRRTERAIHEAQEAERRERERQQRRSGRR